MKNIIKMKNITLELKMKNIILGEFKMKIIFSNSDCTMVTQNVASTLAVPCLVHCCTLKSDFWQCVQTLINCTAVNSSSPLFRLVATPGFGPVKPSTFTKAHETEHE
jgi:hypothetical protein